MASGLGAQFLRVAMGPVAFAGQCLRSGAVSQGLLELGADSLRGALERAVANVAGEVGLSPGAVRRILPAADLASTLARIDQHQAVAASEWREHTGLGGGLLEAVAKLTVDGRPPEASLCLARVAQKMKLEKPLARALNELSEELEAWSALLESCRARIDDGDELQRARRSRELRRMGAAAALVVVVVTAAAALVVRQRARARVDVLLAAADPCTVDRVDAGDLARAGQVHQHRVEQKKAACAAVREQERRAMAARRAAELRARREAEERATRLVRCGRLAAGLATGKLDVEAGALLGALEPWFDKVARRELGADDVVADLGSLPCGDAPHIDRIGGAVAAAVFAAAPYWLASKVPSPSVVALMARGRKRFGAVASAHFGREIERLAQKAVREGRPEGIEHASAVCTVEEQLGLGLRQHCRAATFLARGNAPPSTGH